MSEILPTGRIMARSSAWMIGARLCDRAVGFVSMLVLARLLVPEDFGLVSTAAAIYAGLSVMGEFGFDLAIIQNQRAERADYDTGWTLGIIRGVVVCVALLVAAEPLAASIGDPRLADIIRLFAAISFAEGFINIGTLDFRKNLELNREFHFLFWPRLLATIVTISLAIAWANYWALVVGSLTRMLLRLALSFCMSPYRPRLSLARTRAIMAFSKWMLLSSILHFVVIRGPTLIIGWMIGARSVGLYNMSYELSNLATSELVEPIGRALFPAYAKMSHDLEALRSGYLNGIAVILMAGIPVALGMFSAAEPIVYVLLGEKWHEAVPIIEALSLAGLVTVFTANSGPIYYAVNKPKIVSFIAMIYAGLGLPLFFVGVHFGGVVGLAVGMVAVRSVVFITSFTIIKRLLNFTISSFVSGVWRSAVAGIAMVASVRFVEAGLGNGQAGWMIWQLTMIVLLGAATYVLSLLMLWWGSGCPRGAEQSVLDLARPVASSLLKRTLGSGSEMPK